MSKIKTYITAIEANALYFPEDTQYSSTQRSLALESSFRLVNSYIANNIKVPAVAPWDGEDGSIDAPGILKMLQGQAYRYQLLFTNHGSSPDLVEFFEGITDKLEAIQQSDLYVPEIQGLTGDPGWNITEYSNDGNTGGVYVRGAPPGSFRYHYRIAITTGGYPSALAMDVFTTEQAAAVLQLPAADFYEWQDVNGMFQIRFEGQWTADDEISIEGIPTAEVDTPTKSAGIQQGIIHY